MTFKILLVDDNEAYTDSIMDILEDEGYSVQTANSGEQACAITGNNQFDLILMDIKMPGMNGVETFLKMKEQNPHVNVILFTAYALSELIQIAYANGILAVLKKPLNIDQLGDLIAQRQEKGDGGYILMAADDRALNKNLQKTLVESGYRVAMTCDANDTFCELERQNFDILLLDLNMPNLNSLETYRRIKKLRPDMITILMTGYAEQMNDMIDYTIDDGAYTVLPKPINVEQLLNLLQQITAEKSKGNRKKSGTER